MSVSSELLCSFELLKPLDSSALKSHIKKGRNKRQSMLNSPVSTWQGLVKWHFADPPLSSRQASTRRVTRLQSGICNENLQPCFETSCHGAALRPPLTLLGSLGSFLWMKSIRQFRSIMFSAYLSAIWKPLEGHISSTNAAYLGCGSCQSRISPINERLPWHRMASVTASSCCSLIWRMWASLPLYS